MAPFASPSFTPLPRNNNLPFADYVDWHMSHSSQHAYAKLVASDSSSTIVTMRDFGLAVHTLARHFLKSVAPNNGTVVAIMLSAHPLLYTTTVAALLRAGFQPFPIGASMPEASVAHLLERTKTAHVVCTVGDGPPLPSARAIVDRGTITAVSTMPLSELYPLLDKNTQRSGTPQFNPLPPLYELSPWASTYSVENLPTLILHTSGSTNLPKPIPLRQKALAAWLLCPFVPNFDFCGCLVPAGFLPPHHVAGLAVLLMIPMVSGLVLAMDHPFGSPTPMTPSGLLDFFKRADVDLALAPPVLCNIWANDADAIKFLSTLKLVAVGTAALDSSAGDKLAAGGVRLMSTYGSTEGGQIWQLIAPETPKDWSFGKFYPFIDYRLIPVGVNRYRLELLENDVYSPAVFNNEDGTAFDTHDILERHPTNPQLFRVVERDDNQMVLVTGESVLVAQPENIIREHPSVKQVAVFGHGRAQLGILVEPHDAALRVQPALGVFLAELRPYVMRANIAAPIHAQIPMDLVVVIPPDTSIPISAKGTVPRPLAAKLFAKEIDDAYDSAVQSRSTFQAPEEWTEENVSTFVKLVVQTIVCKLVSDRSLDDDVDIFQQGCNSIHSAYIRGALARSVEQRGWKRSLIPPNVVYQNPTIRQLASFVFTGGQDSRAPEAYQRDKTKSMEELAQRFVSTLVPRTIQEASETHDGGSVVLITGSTGALGSLVLRELLLDEKISCVFALVRQSNGLEQQTAAMIDRGINPDDLPMQKLKVLHGDVCLPNLGLDQETWHRLAETVSTIVHCAWRLDFNLSLDSFQPYVAGVCNLINLATASTLATVPHIVFTSSIDTIHGWNEDRYVPEELVDAKYAVHSGYGESKWVADKVLSEAAKLMGIRTTSLRISQLSGSTLNGCWNVSDWVPQILRASVATGLIPTDREGVVSWLPIDVAAQAVLAVVNNPSDGYRMFNLENPNPVSWRSVFSRMKDESERTTAKPLRDVTPEEWTTAALDYSADESIPPEKNATLHISQFLRDSWGERWTNSDPRRDSVCDAVGMSRLDTTAICSIFPSLSGCKPVVEDVGKWVNYWTKHGLFSGAL